MVTLLYTALRKNDEGAAADRLDQARRAQRAEGFVRRHAAEAGASRGGPQDAEWTS